MYILGIETSCDETAAAIIKGTGDKVEIMSNVVASQIDIHKKYAGIIPEVAAREHVLNILPVIDEAIKKSGKKIDAIAVTYGPGLITSLMAGVETAKSLAFAWEKPLIGVNHIEGHIYANFIRVSSNVKCQMSKLIEFPAIVLIVSGGHTSLVLMKGHGKYKVIGETRDDAAGEAFDKAAKLLNIGYPGGPAISKLAGIYKSSPDKNPISLPRPMMSSGDLDFSFSGLKTSLLYKLKSDEDWPNKISAYAFEFQQAVIDVLISKTIKAAKQYKVKTILLGGGVTANSELRKQLTDSSVLELPYIELRIPQLGYSTDNAAMIATAGYFKALRKEYVDWKKLKTECNLSL